MGIKSRIEFAQGINQFLPGSVVSGTVILQLKHDVPALYVKLLLTGEATTSWKHRHSISVGGHTRSVTEHHSGLVPIIDEERTLWGTGKEEELPAGEHHFTFQFQLPMQCFPEIYSEYGSIRYYCKWFVDGPWEIDHINEQAISVTPIYDISAAASQLLQPQTMKCRDKIGLPLFRRGEVVVAVTLPKTAFSIGETILATVAIANRTSKDVENLEMTLCGCADFVAFHHGAKFPPNVPFIETDGNNVKSSMDEIASSETKVNCPSRSNTIIEAFLEVPNVVPTFECAIIKLYYKLKVEVVTTSTFGSSVVCILPIVIFNGTSRHNVDQQQRVPTMNDDHSRSGTPSAPPLYPPLVERCEPPPPYSSCENEDIPIKE